MRRMHAQVAALTRAHFPGTRTAMTVKTLWQSYFTFTWPFDGISTLYRNSDYEVQAYLVWNYTPSKKFMLPWMSNRTRVIHSFGVKKKFRRKGIGKTLLHAFLGRYKLGDEVLTYTAVHNRPMNLLLAQAGFDLMHCTTKRAKSGWYVWRWQKKENKRA